MRTNISPLHATLLAIGLALLIPQANAQAYKCKGADGKIEYSDRPCDTSKNQIAGPGAAKGEAKKVKIDGIAELKKIFDEFEPSLCEREKLAGEIDRATRSGALQANKKAWAGKQEKLSGLNDQMALFQEKISKITKPAGVDSPEVAAVRKFQMGLKNCDRPTPPPTLPNLPPKK